MAPRTVTVGLVQRTASEDKADNVERAAQGVREAAERGAEIVCLQELFATPYFCQSEDASRFDLAEPVPGPTIDRIAEAARVAKVSVVASVFERRAAGVYHNTAVVLGPDGAIAGMYRKMHIPDDPLYYEKFYFTPGDLGFVAVETPRARIGPLVCWDQWYPEAARLTALAGAEILFYPTAIGWLPSEKSEHGGKQRDAWRTVQRGHAIANGIYVCAVNRVGLEAGSGDGEGIEFWGGSFVCDPFGEVIAEAGAEEETLVVVCDLERVESIRREWPFLRDRRIDAYGGIGSRLLDRDGR